MQLCRLKILGGDADVVNSAGGNFELLGMFMEISSMLLSSRTVSVELFEFSSDPNDLLTNFNQFLLRGVCLVKFSFFGGQV